MATILVVDDEAHIARVLGMWLEQHGYTVLDARDGAAALDLLKSNPVDLVVSDLNMPKVDGQGLARAIREDLKLSIPMLLLTARCDQSALATQLQGYSVQLYPKPFMPSRLVSEINALLSGNEVVPT